MDFWCSEIFHPPPPWKFLDPPLSPNGLFDLYYIILILSILSIIINRLMQANNSNIR